MEWTYVRPAIQVWIRCASCRRLLDNTRFDPHSSMSCIDCKVGEGRKISSSRPSRLGSVPAIKKYNSASNKLSHNMSRIVPTSNATQPYNRRDTDLKTKNSIISKVSSNRQLKYRTETRDSKVTTETMRQTRRKTHDY